MLLGLLLDNLKEGRTDMEKDFLLSSSLDLIRD